MINKKILLCILDGWGLGDRNKTNAVHVAKKQNFDFLSKEFGSIKLFASENGVGLPEGQFGNSEVGHMNIGAGRVLLQDILRINDGFNSGDFPVSENFYSKEVSLPIYPHLSIENVSFVVNNILEFILA